SFFGIARGQVNTQGLLDPRGALGGREIGAHANG
ncbi:MAG: hypothetical protein RLZZ433_334, partial [Pseudomonadota bacterium]